MANAIERIRSLPAGTYPDDHLLEALCEAWGNPEYQAGIAYLRAISASVSATSGPVVECGSGVTTVLLGLLAPAKGVEVLSLEHDAQWASQVRSVLEIHGIEAVHVETSPLVDYGAFDWYRLPAFAPDSISLVICDGPPGSTRGGRFGLLPVVADRLAESAIILLDDAQRPEERAIVQRWVSEFGAALVGTYDDDDGIRAYSILRTSHCA